MRRLIIVIIIAAACFMCMLGCDGGGEESVSPEPPRYVGDITEFPDPAPPRFTFSLDASGTGYVLTDAGDDMSGRVEVPATHNDLPVVEIGGRAFADCRKITEIILPSAVLSVGAYAFDNCKKLQTVTLPDGLTEIGAWAFCGCASLTAVTIPAPVKEIGAYAFWSCVKLSEVVFAAPDGWRAYWSSDAPVGVDLQADDLADPEAAASLLTTTYNFCLWKRAAL